MREQSDKIDTRFVKGFIRRRKRIFLIASTMIFLTAIIASMVVPAVYVSTATILIEGQTTEEMVKGVSYGTIEERLQTIHQQILSRDKLLGIIKQFKLHPNPDDQADVESAIEQMRKNIVVRTIRTEDLDRRASRGRHSTVAFALSYQGVDPAVVQQIASRLAALYIEKNLQTKEMIASQVTTVLQARVNQLGEQAESSGKKLSDFKRQYAGALPESAPHNLEQIYRLTNQLSEVNARIKALEGASAPEGRFSAHGPASGNQTAVDPWTRLSQLRVQLESYQSKYSDKHPDVIKTKNEIQRLEAKLLSSGNDTRDSELRRLQQQKDELERKIAELQRRNQMAPMVQGEYSKLSMEYDNVTRQYNEAKGKLEEAKLMKGIDDSQLGERFTIIDEPVLPRSPENPKKNKILIVGFFLALFGGIFASVIAENLDHSIKTVEQLQKVTKLPVLTVLPFIEREDDNPQTKKYQLSKMVDRITRKLSTRWGQG